MNDDILGVLHAGRGQPLRHNTDGLIEAQAAEIDRLTSERDETDAALLTMTRQALKAEVERDALAAQVAALRQGLFDVTHNGHTAGQCSSGEACPACFPFNNPDAAAAVFVAAERFAHEAQCWLSEGQLASSRELAEALSAYRAALAGEG